MNEPIVLIAVVGGLVSAISAVLVYLGTRGSTRVTREKEIGEREGRYVERLEADRDRLEVLLAACQARESERDASAAARLAGGMVVDVAVTEAEVVEIAERQNVPKRKPSRRGGTHDPS